MPRYRHWQNEAVGGDVSFVTTTALDFARVFQRAEPAAQMTRVLLRECQVLGAPLHAYVVMPHHVHFLVHLPESAQISGLVQRVKSCSAREVRPMLLPSELEEFREQTGLNRRTFWQRSFRSVVVGSESVFWQKVQYIHQNPVRAELSDRSVGYPFSSASAFAAGAWSEESGIDLDWVLRSL